jgi:hypothetical protein
MNVPDADRQQIPRFARNDKLKVGITELFIALDDSLLILRMTNRGGHRKRGSRYPGRVGPFSRQPERNEAPEVCGAMRAPGFAVLFVVGMAGASVGIKEQASFSDFLDWDYVPDVDGNEVPDKYVDVFGGVLGLLLITASCMQVVAAFAMVASRLDLDTPESLTGVEDEVVAFGVAPRFGDSEAEAGGLVEEGEF